MKGLFAPRIRAQHFFKTVLCLVSAFVLTSDRAFADQNFASEERSAAAIGHYARARTLLLEALAEFEAARRIARPDLLLDSEQWRLSVVSRAEDLNRVLDPQPRITKTGARFKAAPSLLGRSDERFKVPAEAPNSTIDESSVEQEKKSDDLPIDMPQKETEKKISKKLDAPKSNKKSEEYSFDLSVDTPSKQIDDEAIVTEPSTVVDGADDSKEVNAIIEKAVEERIKRLAAEERQVR